MSFNEATELLLFLAGVVVGGFIQLVITIVFENPFKKSYHRLMRRYYWLVHRFQLPDPTMSQDFFRIGRWKTECIILEGVGNVSYFPTNIFCRINTNPIGLPADLKRLRNQVDKQQKDIERQKGVARYFNGPMVSFVDYSSSRTIAEEAAILYLRFQLTDYYSFLATSMSLHETIPSRSADPSVTVYEKYLRGTDFKRPIPYIATSFGVNISLVTKDGFLLIAKRGSQGIASYRDMYAVPICESVNPASDRLSDDEVSIIKTAQRGAKEEIGIDVDENEIQFFSLQVDVNWYLYGLSGFIETKNYTRQDIISLRATGVKDKWETDIFHFVRFNPREVALFIKNAGGPSKFNPSSFVSIVQSLIHEYGFNAVSRVFKQMPEL